MHVAVRQVESSYQNEEMQEMVTEETNAHRIRPMTRFGTPHNESHEA
jgi:hypothetical protein